MRLGREWAGRGRRAAVVVGGVVLPFVAWAIGNWEGELLNVTPAPTLWENIIPATFLGLVSFAAAGIGLVVVGVLAQEMWERLLQPVVTWVWRGKE